MKILIVTDTYPPNVNGAALATERLAQELAKRNHTVSVIAPSTSFKYFKKKQGPLTIYRLRSILIQKTQSFRISPQPLHAREFRLIMKEVQPDIIHINNPGFIAQTAIEIARELKVPVVGTSHFMPENLTHYLHLPDQLEKMLNTSIWKLYARFYGRLNLIISPSPTAASLLKRLKVGTRVEVVSNGIDFKKFNTKNNGIYLKIRYKLPNKPTLLFVGRLDREKNIDVLIKAIALIKGKVTFHAIIVGKGKEMNSLKKLASNYGVSSTITFTGYLPKKDLPNIYKTSDIFVMPSIAELQSLVTMEAMACGLPIVGADAVALPHLIRQNKNGFLFKPGNEKDLANKLLILLKDENLRVGMGKKSLEMIKEHDIQKTAARVEEIYKEVINDYKLTYLDKKIARKGVIKTLKRLNIKKLIPQELQI